MRTQTCFNRANRGVLIRRATIAICVVAASILMLRPAAQAHVLALFRSRPLSVIIVGGGPTPDHNQVAIESNVRYVTRLLPPDAHLSTLFADGDVNNASVLYVDDVKSLPASEQALALVLQGNDREFTTYGHYRKPNITGNLDGASSRQNVGMLLDKVGADLQSQGDNGSVLLYFTGHGSPLNSNLENNHYDLWEGSGGLSVHDLAEQISHVPADYPLTVVMAQCFSGAFGNLLFEGVNPSNPYVQRDIAGFFATTKERVAAGCTPALNEADYRDFTSYFFAALTGQDRMGHKVTGADYDRNGHVGMDEAFCYTLIHDESIDVPVCTSDVLLRHDVPFKVDDIKRTPYAELKKWATRPQRAALDGLSARLKLSSEDRYAQGFELMMPREDRTAQQRPDQLALTFQQLRSARRSYLFSRWPDLRHAGSKEYSAAHAEALAQIAASMHDGDAWSELIKDYDARESAETATEESENNAAFALRFVRLCTSVTLAHQLMQTGTPEQKARYTRLVAAERRPLLEPTRQTSNENDGFAVTPSTSHVERY